VPHRAHIMRFCSADSNALEAGYRDRKDELEAAWWQVCPALTDPLAEQWKACSRLAEASAVMLLPQSRVMDQTAGA
jgi:hypothetical protein